jgi:hypothetical protein
MRHPWRIIHKSIIVYNIIDTFHLIYFDADGIIIHKIDGTMRVLNIVVRRSCGKNGIKVFINKFMLLDRTITDIQTMEVFFMPTETAFCRMILNIVPPTWISDR